MDRGQDLLPGVRNDVQPVRLEAARGKGDETMATAGQESLRAQLAHRERELNALWQVTKALASVAGEASLAQTALHAALEAVDAEAGSILLHDPALNQLVFRHVEGGGGSVLIGKGIAMTDGIAGEVFASRRSRVSHDVAREAAHLRAIGEEVGYATHNMITVALCPRGGRPVGVMQVLNKRTGHLDERDLRLLEMLGCQVALDIEQARLYQEAKLAELMRLLGDIGHDLKNMITPVVAATGLLEKVIEDLIKHGPQRQEGRPSAASTSEGPHVEAIAILRDACRRVQSRVKEIADCVKGVTAPLRFSSCSANRVAQQVLDMLRPVAEEGRVSLVLEAAADLPCFEADEDRLFSMLYNLTDNAISAVRRADRPGTVVIATGTKLSGGVQVITMRVSDTGCGMTTETLEQLFSPGSHSAAALGTGLGTRIAKDVVELHGGRIAVESTLGVGTAFSVELPISRRRGA
ncbi:MAG: sensor histidine kinase [Armatimonadota bacterium]